MVLPVSYIQLHHRFLSGRVDIFWKKLLFEKTAFSVYPPSKHTHESCFVVAGPFEVIAVKLISCNDTLNLMIIVIMLLIPCSNHLIP